MIIDSNFKLQENTTEKSNFSKNKKKSACSRIEVTTRNLSRDKKLSSQQFQVTTATNLAFKKKLKHEQVKSSLEKGSCNKERRGRDSRKQINEEICVATSL